MPNSETPDIVQDTVQLSEKILDLVESMIRGLIRLPRLVLGFRNYLHILELADGPLSRIRSAVNDEFNFPFSTRIVGRHNPFCRKFRTHSFR